MTDLQITSTIQTITVDGGENVIAVYPNFAPRSSDFDFATRAEAVAMQSSLLDLADGRTFKAAGLTYIRKAGATEIADMPGFVPNGPASPGHYGAVGDGVANDKAAVDAAADANDEVSILGPTFYNASAGTLDGRFVGPESITTSDGKRARYFSAVKSRPSSLGTHDSAITAFNGDNSKALFPVEYRITGAATLGQPATGYLYTPEATPHYTYLVNSAGHNESTVGNEGRTAATAYRTRVFHSGQGDAMAYNFSVFVSGAKAGATGQTGWLANPAGVALAGEIVAGADGIYLNPMEINLNGGVYDVAGVGLVFNFDRNDSTGDLGAGWDGVRFQSRGTAPVDSAMRVNGPHKVGLNTTQMTTGNAAIAIAAGQRIYFDASLTGGGNLFNTTNGDTYISTPTPGGGLTAVVNNNPVLQLASSGAGISAFASGLYVAPSAAGTSSFRVYGSTSGASPHAAIGVSGTNAFFGAETGGTENTTVTFRTSLAGAERNVFQIDSAGNANIATAGSELQVNGIRVLNGRKTGWAVDTGTAKRTANATYSGTAEATYTQATVQALMDAMRDVSQTIKALKDDLHATAGHGLIGA